jgi:GxxExxY protein
MNTDEHGFKHEELTGKILKVFYEVYNDLGHGFLESVYKKSMVIGLRQAGLQANPEQPIPVSFRGHLVGEFAADVLVESRVMLELKACRALEAAHEAQLLNYLRATPIEVGLLLNFGPKPQVKRFLFDNERKQQRGV